MEGICPHHSHQPCSLQAPSADDSIFPADPEFADDPVHAPHKRAAGATSLTPFPLQQYLWICLSSVVTLACVMLSTSLVFYPEWETPTIGLKWKNVQFWASETTDHLHSILLAPALHLLSPFHMTKVMTPELFLCQGSQPVHTPNF